MNPIPPIPPNCPYFAEREGNAAFFIGDLLLDWVNNPRPSVRPIIAAVARCAWLDEAKRIDNSPIVDQIASPGPGYDECEEIADAWAAWGRGE